MIEDLMILNPVKSYDKETNYTDLNSGIDSNSLSITCAWVRFCANPGIICIEIAVKVIEKAKMASANEMT